MGVSTIGIIMPVVGMPVLPLTPAVPGTDASIIPVAVGMVPFITGSSPLSSPHAAKHRRKPNIPKQIVICFITPHHPLFRFQGIEPLPRGPDRQPVHLCPT
jgi:hypothetical protein